MLKLLTLQYLSLSCHVFDLLCFFSSLQFVYFYYIPSQSTMCSLCELERRQKKKNSWNLVIQWLWDWLQKLWWPSVFLTCPKTLKKSSHSHNSLQKLVVFSPLRVPIILFSGMAFLLKIQMTINTVMMLWVVNRLFIPLLARAPFECNSCEFWRLCMWCRNPASWLYFLSTLSLLNTAQEPLLVPTDLTWQMAWLLQEYSKQGDHVCFHSPNPFLADLD